MSGEVSVDPLGGERRATRLLSENYEPLKAQVIGAVRSRLWAARMRLDLADVDAAYNQAWHEVWEKLATGEVVAGLAGLLVDVTYKRAVDSFRRRHEGVHADAGVDGRAAPVDLVELVDDQVKLDGLLRRLVERLNRNERNAVALCVIHGYSRKEAAELLGVREPALKKTMDRAMSKLNSVVAIVQSRGCGEEEWARAVRDYALATMSTDSPDYERVAAHLQECEACKRFAASLRGLAAVLPPLGAPVAVVGRAGRIAVRVLRVLRGSASGSAGASSAPGAVASSGGSGLTSLLGAGAATKTAVAIVAASVIAAASLPILASHDTGHRRKAAPARVAQPTPLQRPVPVLPAQRVGSPNKRSGVSARRSQQQRRLVDARAARKRLRAAAAREVSRTTGGGGEEEFAFERSEVASEPSVAPETSQPPAGRSEASQASQLEAAEAEFGFEDAK